MTYLSLRDEDSYIIALAGSNGKIRHPLNSQLIPHGGQVVAAIELHFIRDEASTVLFVRGVLKIPASLGLLNEAAYRLLLDTIRDLLGGAPDLQVLGGVPILILRRSLPGAQIGTTRGKGDFEYVGDDEGGEDVADRGINNADAFVRRPSEEPAAG